MGDVTQFWRHVLVVAGARLAVHAIDTGMGIHAHGHAMSLPRGRVSSGPAPELPPVPAPPGAVPAAPHSPAHRLLHRGGPVGEPRPAVPGSPAGLHTWELRLAHCRVSPLLVLQGDVRVPGQKRLHREQVRRTLSPSVQDSRTDAPSAPTRENTPAVQSETAQPADQRLQPPRRRSRLPGN